MNADLLLVLGLLVGLFIVDKPRMDVVGLLVIVILPLTGIISMSEALAGDGGTQAQVNRCRPDRARALASPPAASRGRRRDQGGECPGRRRDRGNRALRKEKLERDASILEQVPRETS